jgi:hypothetical protein
MIIPRLQAIGFPSIQTTVSGKTLGGRANYGALAELDARNVIDPLWCKELMFTHPLKAVWLLSSFRIAR